MEKIYVVCLETGEYEEYDKRVEFVSTNLDLVKARTEELFSENLDEYTNVIIEIWQNDEFIGTLKYNKKRVISYELYNWQETKIKKSIDIN